MNMNMNKWINTRTKYLWNVWHPRTTIAPAENMGTQRKMKMHNLWFIFLQTMPGVLNWYESPTYIEISQIRYIKKYYQRNMSPKCIENILSIWSRCIHEEKWKDIFNNTYYNVIPFPKLCAIRWSAQITRQNIYKKNFTAGKVFKEGGLLDFWSKARLIGRIYKSIWISYRSTVHVIEAGGLSSARSQNARD